MRVGSELLEAKHLLTDRLSTEQRVRRPVCRDIELAIVTLCNYRNCIVSSCVSYRSGGAAGEEVTVGRNRVVRLRDLT